MVYRLEILKARHLQGRGRGRVAKEEGGEEGRGEAVARGLIAGPRS
jgi:hypothetical protein